MGPSKVSDARLQGQLLNEFATSARAFKERLKTEIWEHRHTADQLQEARAEREEIQRECEFALYLTETAQEERDRAVKAQQEARQVSESADARRRKAVQEVEQGKAELASVKANLAAFTLSLSDDFKTLYESLDELLVQLDQFGHELAGHFSICGMQTRGNQSRLVAESFTTARQKLYETMRQKVAEKSLAPEASEAAKRDTKAMKTVAVRLQTATRTTVAHYRDLLNKSTTRHSAIPVAQRSSVAATLQRKLDDLDQVIRAFTDQLIFSSNQSFNAGKLLMRKDQENMDLRARYEKEMKALRYLMVKYLDQHGVDIETELPVKLRRMLIVDVDSAEVVDSGNEDVRSGKGRPAYRDICVPANLEQASGLRLNNNANIMTGRLNQLLDAGTQ